MEFTFDDVTKGEYGYWTQVCKNHAKFLPNYGLSNEGEGHGICGVEGCRTESDYYYDFGD